MNAGLLAQLHRLAGGRCDYCRIPAAFDPLPFQVDHIIAQQHGGETVLENLAWSCLHDNKQKGPNIAGIDPLTKQLVPLFHPRGSAGGVILCGMVRSSSGGPASVVRRFGSWRSTIPKPWRFGPN